MREGFVKAKIQWVSHKDGGRMIPPTGKTYAGTLSFNNDVHDQWSYFIENYEAPDPTTLTHFVEMTMLVREMADVYLTPGRKFEAYEGRRLVARGEVLNDTGNET